MNDAPIDSSNGKCLLWGKDIKDGKRCKFLSLAKRARFPDYICPYCGESNLHKSIRITSRKNKIIVDLVRCRKCKRIISQSALSLEILDGNKIINLEKLVENSNPI